MPTFPLLDEPPAPAPRAMYTGGTTIGDELQLGVGLLAPFRRDLRVDFAAGSGDALVRSAIAQVLLTRADDGKASGELPWRPEFGSLLHRLQYLAIDESYAALVRTRVVGAISLWEPRVRIDDVSVVRSQNARGEIQAYIHVIYRIVQSGAARTLSAPQHLDVPVGA